MTDEQLKELTDLRVAIQDLKYQLTQKHEEIEDRESAIYATGYWNGIAYKKMRELTDEEICKLWAESHEDSIAMQQGFTTQQHYFAHLILKKASEK